MFILKILVQNISETFQVSQYVVLYFQGCIQDLNATFVVCECPILLSGDSLGLKYAAMSCLCLWGPEEGKVL